MLQNRTLLYLASGEYRLEYEKLPYDQIILVDKSSVYQNVQLPEGSKVKFLNMEASKAIKQLKNKNIKIDCLVILNEGLGEGGALYPFYSDFFIGFLLPILSEEFILVTDINYYECYRLKTRIGKLDWGIEKIKNIKPTINDMLKPGVFSYKQHLKKDVDNINYGNMFHLQLVKKDVVIRTFGNITVELKHGSIWNDENTLDGIGCVMSQKTSNDINFSSLCRKTEQKIQLFDLGTMSFDEIVTQCIEKDIKHLGFVPWMNGNYTNFFEWLLNNKIKVPLKITLYHLNKKDYNSLYKCFGMYFLNTYNNLFQKMYEDLTRWKDFESTLDMKTGYFLDKMCHEINLYYQENPKVKIVPFTQVKLKFGRLRIYASFSRDRYVNALINLTEL